MSDTTFHLVKEAYDRATELLQLCNRARVLMPDTAAGESWTNDFLAYLRIQVGRAEEQNKVYEQRGDDDADL